MTVIQPTLDQLMVPIDQVLPNPDNVRSDLGDLDELVDSILSVGILEPLIAFRTPDGWMLIAGHRRLAAAVDAGLDEVPIVAKETPDAVSLAEMMLAENTQRRGLDPIDEGLALLRIQKSGRYPKLADIAGKVNRSAEWVAQRISLAARLPEGAWPAVRTGEVTIGDAVTIAGLDLGAYEKLQLTRSAKDGNRFELSRAVADQKLMKARQALIDEHGEIVEWEQFRARQGPWGSVPLGDNDGQLNIPANLHRACPGHVAFWASPTTVQVVCVTPLAHEDDFPDDEWPTVPTKAKPISDFDWARPVERAHLHHCPHSDVVRFPWDEIAVCTDPTIHTNPKRKGHISSEDLYEALLPAPTGSPAAGTGSPSRPDLRTVWEPGQPTLDLLRERLTEALANLDPTIVQVLHLLAADLWGETLVDGVVEQAVVLLRSLKDREGVGLLDDHEAPAADGILWIVQATVDAGQPIPTLDQIRTRLEVLTRGETGGGDAA